MLGSKLIIFIAKKNHASHLRLAYNPYYYVETFALARGFDSNVTLYILAIQNAGSFFGRVIPGILADKVGLCVAICP